MTEEEIKDFIKFCLPHVYSGHIENEADLRRDLLADDLTFHHIAIDFGDELNIDIEDEDVAKWVTVQDVLDFVKEKQQ